MNREEPPTTKPPDPSASSPIPSSWDADLRERFLTERAAATTAIRRREAEYALRARLLTLAELLEHPAFCTYEDSSRAEAELRGEDPPLDAALARVAEACARLPEAAQVVMRPSCDTAVDELVRELLRMVVRQQDASDIGRWFVERRRVLDGVEPDTWGAFVRRVRDELPASAAEQSQIQRPRGPDFTTLDAARGTRRSNRSSVSKSIAADLRAIHRGTDEADPQIPVVPGKQQEQSKAASDVGADAARPSLPPMTPKVEAVLRILVELPPHEARTSTWIANTLDKRGLPYTPGDEMRSRIIPKLKAPEIGLKSCGRAGYYLPVDAPARKALG